MAAEEISFKKMVDAHQQRMANPSMIAAALRAGSLAVQKEVEAQTFGGAAQIPRSMNEDALMQGASQV